MGYIGDRSYVNCFYFYAAMILLAGLSTLLVPVLTSFALLAAYCAAFGLFMSANYALTTIIVVELLGMDQLTNAYGFVSLSEGVANLFGPPLAGRLALVLKHSFLISLFSFYVPFSVLARIGRFPDNLSPPCASVLR